MAFIIAPDNITVHLKQSHILGRLPSAVDTFIGDNAVSRLHFLIEYNDDDWYLVDYSRNGTFVNKKRVNRNTQIKLSEGDHIALGQHHAVQFTLADAAPPKDLLCCRLTGEHPITKTIELSEQQLFKSDDEQLTLFKQQGNWVVNHQGHTRRVFDGDWLTFNGEKWQLVLTNTPSSTVNLLNNSLSADDLVLHLFTSLDEETTRCHLLTEAGEIDLQVRSHHYLMLLLARQRILHNQQNIDPTEQGWVYIQELMAMLNMAETQVNLHIHRARKQVDQALDGLISSEQLIERRAGQVRLNFNKITIHKGADTESSIE